MKKVWNKITSAFLSVLPHINIALAAVLLVLFVTDRFNRAMAFINNDITKWMLCVFCVTSLLQAIIFAYKRRKEIDNRRENGPQ